MGFSSVKRAILAALEAGNFQHEAREVLSEKNLLAVGDISVGTRAYVKTYFIEEPEGTAVFISIHR